jgi:formylglycine-generating enzyme required for sulfatase activity
MPRIPKLYVSHYLSRVSAFLDRQPLPRVLMTGVVLGLGLGAPGFFYLRSPAWLLLWGVLFVALWRMADSAEPVFEEDTLVAVEARPQRVRDGPLVMVDLPGGQFHMGSPDTDEMAHDNEKPQHTVTISGFRMAVTPVTAGLYNEVMQKEPLPEEEARLPAADVTWYDAIEFCNRLSIREGYRPCYRQRLKRWVCDWRSNGYRLPTEAEWEYACRAGTTTRYAFGDDPGRLGDYAWFVDNASDRPHEVAQKRPNGWGLYDMHGNVWEWCWDGYKLYSLWRVRNWNDLRDFLQPRWRVVRGGSFDGPPEDLRSALRDGDLPVSRGRRVGFRCVRVPPAS